jgi:predicted ATP-dependent endonuclease of OLD family
MPNFTLHVENFGKIKKADIAPSQITFFVGDNNSGKSYLMTLLYGLMSHKFYQLMTGNFNQYTANFVEIFEKYLSNRLGNRLENNIYRSTEADVIELEKALNRFLEEFKDAFVETLFNEKISIDILRITINPKCSFEIYFSEKTKNIDIWFLKNDEKKGYSRLFSEVFENSIKHDAKSFSASILYYFFKFIINDRIDIEEIPVYLPASRIGLLLTYKPVISHSIAKTYSISLDSSENELANAALLTCPVIHFLQLLSSFSTRKHIAKDNQQNLVSFIEKNIIGGEIIVNNSPVPDYLYRPVDSSILLPVHVSSGAVTEMAPILLVLQRCKISCLMIEEPEMSLHPALQKQMGRLLVKIANNVGPIIVSTNCDVIIQHLINMARLKKHPESLSLKKEFGYDEDELIEKEQLAIYQFDSCQFDSHDTQTSVKKLEWSGENEIKVSTFVSFLSQMLDETMKIGDQ